MPIDQESSPANRWLQITSLYPLWLKYDMKHYTNLRFLVHITINLILSSWTNSWEKKNMLIALCYSTLYINFCLLISNCKYKLFHELQYWNIWSELFFCKPDCPRFYETFFFILHAVIFLTLLSFLTKKKSLFFFNYWQKNWFSNSSQPKKSLMIFINFVAPS